MQGRRFPQTKTGRTKLRKPITGASSAVNRKRLKILPLFQAWDGTCLSSVSAGSAKFFCNASLGAGDLFGGPMVVCVLCDSERLTLRIPVTRSLPRRFFLAFDEKDPRQKPRDNPAHWCINAVPIVSWIPLSVWFQGLTRGASPERPGKTLSVEQSIPHWRFRPPHRSNP